MEADLSSTFVLLNIFKLKDSVAIDQDTVKAVREGLAETTSLGGKVVQQSFGITVEDPKRLYWLLCTYHLISSSLPVLTRRMA